VFYFSLKERARSQDFAPKSYKSYLQWLEKNSILNRRDRANLLAIEEKKSDQNYLVQNKNISN
jgi:hypothetical protein